MDRRDTAVEGDRDQQVFRFPFAAVVLADADQPPARRIDREIRITGLVLGRQRARFGADHTVLPRTAKAPPPYSWTRLRALNVRGMASATVPSAARHTIAVRPSSAGRCSAQ
jgi:hypothetical protein